MLRNPQQRQLGFTLVELVTTIILISILSVTVLPRFFSPSSYSAYSLRNEFMAEMRKVQQKAMNNTDRCYRIAVSANGFETIQFDGRDNTGCIGTQSPLDSQVFQGGANLTLISNHANSFNLDFDSYGRTSLACNGNCIEVMADETLLINISSEGYIYAN
ncbi:pilus assembly FimT family protein [Shewanella acanthi]|uniref:pilus assembly FimT family protein n=1 Tax=Shewanella acanthi TaxID=2864212 RepID=UPI001C656B90|nr:type II secretion system protein [Shewanella acanthi]QYJ78467.1 type II secretion system GspH family protein [Shewanella acanthi]